MQAWGMLAGSAAQRRRTATPAKTNQRASLETAFRPDLLTTAARLFNCLSWPQLWPSAATTSPAGAQTRPARAPSLRAPRVGAAYRGATRAARLAEAHWARVRRCRC